MITMTAEAVSQLKDFLTDQGTPDHALRVFVAPGGCSGLQYGMTIDETSDEGDEIIETGGDRHDIEGDLVPLHPLHRRCVLHQSSLERRPRCYSPS